jgi:DNA-binding transcriptional LysR family regulator
MQAHRPARRLLPVMADERIRISVPRVLGEFFLRRAMAPLATRFPHLVVDLVSTRDPGLTPRDPEIALRLSRPSGNGFVARRMATRQELWLIVRPDAAPLAPVRAVVDHLAMLVEDSVPGSEAA